MVEGLDLPENKQFSLKNGLLLLDRENADLLANGELGFVTYNLYYDESEVPVYQDELSLPLEEINLIEIITNDLTEDGEPLSSDIQVFLTSISNEIGVKKKKRKPRTKKEKRALQTQVTPVQEDFEEETKKVVETERPGAEKKSKDKAKNKRFLMFYLPWSKSPIKLKYVMLAVFSMFILLIAVKVFNSVDFNTAQEQQSYETLIDQKDYLTAAKDYPTKRKAIEQILYDKAVKNKTEKSKKALKTYQKTYPTVFGKFDLAIIETNYDLALKTYESNEKQFSSNNDRLTLVGYCYLKDGQVNKAKEMVKVTRSTELERYIYDYEQKQAEITDLEKYLEELKKNPIENRDEIEKTMNQLFDVKEELLNI